jgi:hypothetical protein
VLASVFQPGPTSVDQQMLVPIAKGQFNPMRENGIQFKQCSNAFLNCAAPDRLQEPARPGELAHCSAVAETARG